MGLILRRVVIQCVETGDVDQCGLRLALVEGGREKWFTIITATNPGALWDNLHGAEKTGALSEDEFKFVRKSIRSVRCALGWV
jgi:hypothetical protein